MCTAITGERFQRWRREREVVENIREGKPYFNGVPEQPPAEKHTPSQLLRCHRHSYYRSSNAPKEERDPAGIFWFGSAFETDIAVPFLRDLTGPDQIVRNSMWVDFTVSSDAGRLTIRGETDPVIVDRDSTPQLLTEIKTTSSVSHLDSAKTRHKAQAHAYMYGLSEEYSCDLHDAVIIYASRDTLGLKSFHVPFDPFFWRETVLNWAAEDTGYRSGGELPPANPEQEWECEFCPYRTRCGQTDSHYGDMSPVGLLPLTEYPRQQAKEHVEAHPETKLTPALAHLYPELAREYDVWDWHCEICGATFTWDEVEWEQDLSSPPVCPECPGSHPPGTLAGSIPRELLGPENEND